MTKTLSDSTTEYVNEHYDGEIKYKPMYALCVILTIFAPYMMGPLIAINERRLIALGWMPYYTEATDKTIDIPLKNI